MRRRARGSQAPPSGPASPDASIEVDPDMAAQIQGGATREPERLLRALRMARARRLAIGEPIAQTTRPR